MKKIFGLLIVVVFASCVGDSGSTKIPPKKVIEDKLFGLYLSRLESTSPDSLIMTKLNANQVTVYENKDKAGQRAKTTYTMTYNSDVSTHNDVSYNEGNFGIKIFSKSSDTQFSCDCINLYNNGVTPFEGSYALYYKKP